MSAFARVRSSSSSDFLSFATLFPTFDPCRISTVIAQPSSAASRSAIGCSATSPPSTLAIALSSWRCRSTTSRSDMCPARTGRCPRDKRATRMRRGCSTSCRGRRGFASDSGARCVVPAFPRPPLHVMWQTVELENEAELPHRLECSARPSARRSRSRRPTRVGVRRWLGTLAVARRRVVRPAPGSTLRHRRRPPTTPTRASRGGADRRVERAGPSARARARRRSARPRPRAAAAAIVALRLATAAGGVDGGATRGRLARARRLTQRCW